MSACLERFEDVSALREAVRTILGPGDFEAYRFCDDVAGEHKVYEVFKIVRSDGTFVLKRFDDPKRSAAEKAIYARLSPALPVPRALGFAADCMGTAFVPGEDLRNMTDESVSAAALSVAEILNAFPPGYGYDRTDADAEIAYRERRLENLKGEPLLSEAYSDRESISPFQSQGFPLISQAGFFRKVLFPP